MSATVHYEETGKVGILTLDEAASLNACGNDTARAILEILQDVDAGRKPVRALVITGAGRAFSSGADLHSAATDAASAAKSDLGAQLRDSYNPLLNALRDVSVPVVTAVNGLAAGIGCSIALMGDLIVAGESAFFLQAFRNIGLVPDGGATWMLPRLVGRVRTMEMVLLGDKVNSAKAMAWGMINRRVPDTDVLAEATALADRLAGGPLSLGMIRRLIHRSCEGGWQEQLDAECDAQRTAGRTADYVEGIQAFLHHRAAVFTGT